MAHACRILFSPKGWDNLAQGNVLGHGPFFIRHPEGVRQVLSQAFSLEEKCNRVPGALPQARLSQPFGLMP